MLPYSSLGVALASAALTVTAPKAAHASGCGGTARAGEIDVAVLHAGRSRSVHVYVPTGYDANWPTPLLLNLHGSGSTGKKQFVLSGLSSSADLHNVIIVSPDGGIPTETVFLWHVPGVPTVAGTIPGDRAPDDTSYLLAAVDAVARYVCVDFARVYSTGFSGGGRMASWLACSRAHRIAAIAPVVGLRAGRATDEDTMKINLDSCRPTRPIGIIAFVGAMDRTNPIEGGEGLRWGYSMLQALQRWGVLNECRTTQATIWIKSFRYRQGYSGCLNGVRVEAIVDRDGGHEWRVADNDAMLSFLLAHRLQTKPRNPK